MSATSFIQRLLLKVRMARCKGSIDYLPQDHAVTLYAQATSGLDVGALDGGQLALFNCSEGRKRCERCPRFQAFREIMRAYKERKRDLHVGAATQHMKSSSCDGDGKRAEVTHLNADEVFTIRISTVPGDNADTHPVGNPSFPGVEHAQARSENGQTECEPLTQFVAVSHKPSRFVEVSIVAQGGAQ